MQGVAVGLYCLWGAIRPARAREVLRYLVLYMICVSVGRAIAAVPFFSNLTSKPVVFFALDTAITVVSAILLYRDHHAPGLKTTVAPA
jgi:hypothetical protein